MSYLFTFKSVTQAQRAQNIMSGAGIISHIIRPPAGLMRGSCGYGIKVSGKDAAAALGKLRSFAAAPVKIFSENEGAFTEVKL